jgi:hypothetical protein
MSRATCAAAVVLLAFGGIMLARAEEDKRGIDGLGWMQGEWVRQQDDDRLEEIWSAPSEDSLIGMFRWSKQGKLWMTELMHITVEGEEVVFRLKHFGRDLAGWEPNDPPAAYKLVEQGDRRAVFENPKVDNPRRFLFSVDDEGRYTVRLESVKGEKTTAMEFVFEKRE